MGNCQYRCSAVQRLSSKTTIDKIQHKETEKSLVTTVIPADSLRTELSTSSNSFTDQISHQESENLIVNEKSTTADFDSDTGDRKEPRELGALAYDFSSLEEARRESRLHHKPILLIQLLHKVEADNEIFSHQLFAEAANSLFIVVVDIVKTRGMMMRWKRSGTKVRFLSDYGKDIVDEIDTLLPAQILISMVAALKEYEKPIPKYVQLMLEEQCGKAEIHNGLVWRVDNKVVFGVTSSESGEAELAGLDGIIATKAGFVNHRNVVQVTYNSSRINYGNLVLQGLKKKVVDSVYYETTDQQAAAQREIQRLHGSAHIIRAELVKLDTDVITPNPSSKQALRNSMLRFVPLTALQATRANKLIHDGTFNEAMHLLSPRQGMMLMQTMRDSQKGVFQDLVDIPFGVAWSKHTSVSSCK